MQGCLLEDMHFETFNLESDEAVITPDYLVLELGLATADGGSADGYGAFTIVGTRKRDSRPLEGVHFDVSFDSCARVVSVADGGVVREPASETPLVMEPDVGCQQRSTSFLQCILGADGTARFNVRLVPDRVRRGTRSSIAIRSGGRDGICRPAVISIENGISSDSILRVDVTTLEPELVAGTLACGAVSAPCLYKQSAFVQSALMSADGGIPSVLIRSIPVDLEIDAQTGQSVYFANPRGGAPCESSPGVVKSNQFISPSSALSELTPLCVSTQGARFGVVASVAPSGSVELFRSRGDVIIPPVPTNLVATVVSVGEEGALVDVRVYDCRGLSVPRPRLVFESALGVPLAVDVVEETSAGGFYRTLFLVRGVAAGSVARVRAAGSSQGCEVSFL
jgi:hypothetical protein